MSRPPQHRAQQTQSDQPYTPDALAWDIETAPLPLSSLSDRQRRRARIEYDEQSRRKGHKSVTTLLRRAMSFHGFLCWICALSFAWRDEEGEIQTASKIAKKPVQEARLLRWFWRQMKGREGLTFVTFNGKNFDCRIARTRSIAQGVPITNEDVLDEYPYSYTPHADLGGLWGKDWVGLEDAADIMGVQYDSEITGEQVAEAVVQDRLDLVEQHCNADVRTTLVIYEQAKKITPELR